MDLINRESLLQQCSDYCKANCKYTEVEQEVMCRACRTGDIIEFIKEASSENDCNVLLQTVHFGIVVGRYEEVFNKDGSNAEMRFLIHKSISSDDMASVDVIAWQPLPELYKEPKQIFKEGVD